MLPIDADSILPIPTLVQACIERWWASPTAPPDLGRRYSASEQSAGEAQLAQLAQAFGRDLEQPPQTPAAQRAMQLRYLAQTRSLAITTLGFAAAEVDAMRLEAFADLMLDYARQARRFDPRLTTADVIQAGRNVMSAGLLQLVLGRPVELTPAILAYSLLYPYSDNVLDDPKLSVSSKRAFNQRFRRRLAGHPLSPADEREAAIERLIGMIEAQYDRRQFPQVFASLLAIHAAQNRSLELLQPEAGPYEVDLLGVTFDKGGTSVLADAYLVAGDLTAREQTLAFELGAFLQFFDDLEDVQADLAAGRLSVFALAARGWRLDALTNRAFHFGAGVLDGLDQPGLPAAAGARNFLRRGLQQALIFTAGRARRWYNRSYWRELESHVPFRFAFVDRLAYRLSRQLARGLPRLETAGLDLAPALLSGRRHPADPLTAGVG